MIKVHVSWTQKSCFQRKKNGRYNKHAPLFIVNIYTSGCSYHFSFSGFSWLLLYVVTCNFFIVLIYFFYLKRNLTVQCLRKIIYMVFYNAERLCNKSNATSYLTRPFQQYFKLTLFTSRENVFCKICFILRVFGGDTSMECLNSLSCIILTLILH